MAHRAMSAALSPAAVTTIVWGEPFSLGASCRFVGENVSKNDGNFSRDLSSVQFVVSTNARTVREKSVVIQ
jgi:hypothetical protein